MAPAIPVPKQFSNCDDGVEFLIMSHLFSFVDSCRPREEEGSIMMATEQKVPDMMQRS